jgi:acetyl-CoA synthetase
MASPEPIDATLQSWADVASALRWYSPWDRVWDAAPPAGTWFPGGRLNLAANCLDRHLPARADDVALYWEGEPGDSREITYGELHREVVALVRALRSMGVGPADRVALHLGWIPETAVALLACARIGRRPDRAPRRLLAQSRLHPGRGLAPWRDPAAEGAGR